MGLGEVVNAVKLIVCVVLALLLLCMGLLGWDFVAHKLINSVIKFAVGVATTHPYVAAFVIGLSAILAYFFPSSSPPPPQPQQRPQGSSAGASPMPDEDDDDDPHDDDGMEQQTPPSTTTSSSAGPQDVD